MINVLFVESSTGFGGSGKYLWELLRLLDRTKFCPFVIYSGDGLNIKKIKNLGVVNYQVNLTFPTCTKSFLSYARQLLWFVFIAFPKALKMAGIIIRHGIQIVYLNNEILSHIPSIIAAKLCGKRVVCHNHGLRKLTRMELFFVPWIDWFVCVSNATYQAIKKDVNGSPVSVVHNGLDISEYDLSAVHFMPELRNLKNSHYLVGIFGRIVEWKGHRVFVRAAAKIAAQIKKVKFVVMGDDLSEKKFFLAEIKSEIKRLGLEEIFLFTGWQANVLTTICGLDVVIHPSVEPEPFGLTIIEAMALERAVVASDLGAIPEIIEDQFDGLLFEAGDADELAEKVLFLLADDPLRIDLGKNAREKVSQKFSIQKTVDQIQSILERVVQ